MFVIYDKCLITDRLLLEESFLVAPSRLLGFIFTGVSDELHLQQHLS